MAVALCVSEPSDRMMRGVLRAPIDGFAETLIPL